MAGQEYDDILASLRDRLSQETGWAKVFFYGVVDAILKATAWVMSQVKYITDVFFRESGWATAQLNKSLAQRAEFLSYKPARAIGAGGSVVTSANSAFSSSYVYTGSPVIIPRWTRMTNDNQDVDVYSTADITYAFNTTGNQTIPVREGVPKTFTYVGQNIVNETVTIYSNLIDNGEIEVFIVDAFNNILHTVNICGKNGVAEKLYFINDLEAYYCEAKTSYDFQSVNFVFGDNVHTRKLASGERVLIKYAETKGDTGNITSSGIITKFRDTLLDIDGNAVTLYVTNQSEISNGNAIEDIEYTRNFAPRLFVAGYRAGGDSDWITLLEAHPYIYKAIVNVTANDPFNNNKVFVTAISADGSDLTLSEKDEVTLYMKDKKSPDEIIAWEVLEEVFLVFKINATITNKPISVVSGEIYTALHDAYGILNTPFQTNIYKSNWVAIIDDLADVLHHESEVWQLEKNAGGSFDYVLNGHEILVSNTTYDTAVLKDQIFMVPGTFEVYLEQRSGTVWGNPQVIARDYYGAGTLSGAAGFTVSSSALDYNLNLVSYSIFDLANIPQYGLPNTDYKIFLSYQTRDGLSGSLNAVRMPSPKQITDIEQKYQIINLVYA